MVECSGLENLAGEAPETAETVDLCGLQPAQDAPFTNRSASDDGAKVGTATWWEVDPWASDLAPPKSADVYQRTVPAIFAVAQAAGCDREQGEAILRAVVEAGYFIAPRIPTDPMLYAYFNAYGAQAWSPRTIIQNIGKARLRWQAMGQAGTAMALSRRFLHRAPDEDAQKAGE